MTELADEGVCAFCGTECSNAELMMTIHHAIETLISVSPEEEGFQEALDEVKRKIGVM